MKRKIFFFFIIFIIAPCFVRASEVNLGSFSVEEVQKVIGSPIFFHVNNQKIAADKNAMQSFLKIRPALKMNPNYNSEAENINFFPTDDPMLKIYYRFLGRERDRYHIRISTSLSVDEDSLGGFVNKLKDETRVDPENAKLAFEGDKVSAFSTNKNGYEISDQESRENIIKALQEDPYKKDINLPTKVLEPEITSTNLDKYGIKKLIGQGTSNFRGSPKNRIHNINVGASRFNGVIIKPGEEFSFIKTLGPVDASTGYLPELVIKVDKTIPEYGGGMCQVSTTCFRAALNAGLKITARTNHAYPVQYYAPQGTDATVYIPNPDLRFVNDTPGYILMQTHIEGTQLAFDFYGTSDGRKAKLVGPTVTSRGEEGAMKTVLYQEVYGADGNLIRKSEFKSSYDSPSKYPHPGQEKITEKPTDWSSKEWKEYKKANGM
ncbi:MAG: VanW family protein [Candidatus Moranbacteria bacterium]|nr:VanW family protein [Candidatus Moranbacteria bacterium]